MEIKVQCDVSLTHEHYAGKPLKLHRGTLTISVPGRDVNRKYVLMMDCENETVEVFSRNIDEDPLCILDDNIENSLPHINDPALRIFTVVAIMSCMYPMSCVTNDNTGCRDDDDSTDSIHDVNKDTEKLTVCAGLSTPDIRKFTIAYSVNHTTSIVDPELQDKFLAFLRS